MLSASYPINLSTITAETSICATKKGAEKSVPLPQPSFLALFQTI